MTAESGAGGDLDRETSGAVDAGLALLLSALAIALRALTWPAVFTAEGIRLVGPDAHYHLRRILWSVESFPAVLSRDAYVAFPNGGELIWTPAFDWAIAALARAAIGTGDPAGVEGLAVWVPAILGGATVGLVFLTGQRAFGRRVGLLAGIVLCVLPPHVWYSQLGFVDHHAAVAFATAGLIAATLAAFAASPAGRPGPWVALGCVMGGCLLLWPGSLLQVGIVQLAILARIVSGHSETVASDNAAGAAFAHGAAFLLVAPFAVTAFAHGESTWGDLSPVVLSGFQPLWLGLPALAFGGCALAWRAGIAGASPRARTLAVGAALGLPFLVALALPPVRAGVAAAWIWFFRAEAFQAVVAESLPLLSDGQSFTLQRAHTALTPLVYALPLLLAALATTARRRTAHRTIALFCLVLSAATLAQYRFANSFSVAWALTIACGLDLAWRTAARLRFASRAGLALAASMAGIALLAPIARSHARALGTAQRFLAGETTRAHEQVAHHTSLIDAARWLGDHSPPTRGWLSSDEMPRYGVLTAWGDGHVTRYVARRPVVQDNFGDDVGAAGFAAAERYFAAGSEAEALRVASKFRIRYVLVREAGSGHAPAPYESRSMLARLHRLRGSAGSLRPGGHLDAPIFAPALARHRLVYESEYGPSDEAGGRFKLYEIVKGAAIEGRAAPGELVEARLILSGEPGRFEYRAHSRAGPDGRYQLHLPYPTQPFEGQFAPVGSYAIESLGRVAPFSVDEQAVRSGQTLEGPDLVP